MLRLINIRDSRLHELGMLPRCAVVTYFCGTGFKLKKNVTLIISIVGVRPL